MVSIQSLDSIKVYFISYILCESPGGSPTIPNIERRKVRTKNRSKEQKQRTKAKNKSKEQKQRAETRNRNEEQKQRVDNRKEKQTQRETEKKK